jgi:hypothetical protein
MPEQDTHVGFALRAFSDAGSTPAASTDLLTSILAEDMRLTGPFLYSTIPRNYVNWFSYCDRLASHEAILPR